MVPSGIDTAGLESAARHVTAPLTYCTECAAKFGKCPCAKCSRYVQLIAWYGQVLPFPFPPAFYTFSSSYFCFSPSSLSAHASRVSSSSFSAHHHFPLSFHKIFSLRHVTVSCPFLADIACRCVSLCVGPPPSFYFLPLLGKSS